MTNAKNNVDPSIAITQYETLRAAALGNALPLEARAGVMRFLHAGMWGWARAVTAMRTFERPAGSRPSKRLRNAGQVRFAVVDRGAQPAVGSSSWS